MRTIITLVASIAILGASPAPADAKWFKKVFKAVTKSIIKPDCWPGIAGHMLDDNATGDVSDEEVLQPTRDAAEDVGRKIDEELLQPTDDAAEKPVPERRLGFAGTCRTSSPAQLVMRPNFSAGSVVAVTLDLGDRPGGLAAHRPRSPSPNAASISGACRTSSPA